MTSHEQSPMFIADLDRTLTLPIYNSFRCP